MIYDDNTQKQINSMENYPTIPIGLQLSTIWGGFEDSRLNFASCGYHSRIDVDRLDCRHKQGGLERFFTFSSRYTFKKTRTYKMYAFYANHPQRGGE